MRMRARTQKHTNGQNVLTAARLDLSKADVRGVMAEVDANGDGVPEYREFLPAMVQLISGLNTRKRERLAAVEAEAEREEVSAEVTDMLLHGMRREELEALMLSVFQAADADNSGYLDRREFQACLDRGEMKVLLTTFKVRASHEERCACIHPSDKEHAM